MLFVSLRNNTLFAFEFPVHRPHCSVLIHQVLARFFCQRSTFNFAFHSRYPSIPISFLLLYLLSFLLCYVQCPLHRGLLSALPKNHYRVKLGYSSVPLQDEKSVMGVGIITTLLLLPFTKILLIRKYFFSASDENSSNPSSHIPISRDPFTIFVAPKHLPYGFSKPEYVDSSGSYGDTVSSRRRLSVPLIVCTSSTSSTSSFSFDSHYSDSTYVLLLPL